MDTSLPELLQENDILKNIAIVMDKKFTQPPARFNEASLLEEMERKKIGTKATRSEVISTLFKRNYITTTAATTASPQREYGRIGGGGGGIEATDVGFKIIQSMRKYIPNIVSTELTRSMEEQLDSIESGKARSSSVIDWAKDRLREAIVHFKENEIEIGREITEAVIVVSQNQQQQRQLQTVLWTCPVCNKGVLKIIRSTTSKKRFVGCSNYFSGVCKATAPLPQKGSIKTTHRTCALCRWPILRTIYPTKRHWEFCINLQCPSKKKDIKT
jgi:DNA topoisomerase-1